MRWLRWALSLPPRAQRFVCGVVALVLVGSLVWAQATDRAEQRAEAERLQRAERARIEADRKTEELRDDFRSIEERSAAGGDDAVLERMRDGGFGLIPGSASTTADTQDIHP